MVSPKDTVLGVDIGGSHITLALVNVSEKKILEESYHRAPVNSWATCENIINTWAEAIELVYAGANIPVGHIGIAMPGPFDYENGISYIRGNKKYDSLYGVNVKQLLAKRLNIAPENIRLLNDAAAFLQGEAFAGIAKKYKKVIGLTLGTGLGTTVYDNGVAKDAALWDSSFLDGIAEDYISSRWFVNRYFELTGINIINVKALNSIYPESSVVKDVFKEFAANLALFIKQFVEAEQPEIVVLGGNITNASPRFMPFLNRNLAQQGINVPIYISTLGEHAAMLGAASCWQVD